MAGPVHRTDAEARALLDAELEHLAPRRPALGEAGAFAVAGWRLTHAYEWEAAALAWDRAAALDPHDPELVFEHGVCLLEMGLWNDAAATFRRVMDIDARLVADGHDGIEWMECDPAYRLGMALHAAGDLDAAIDAYELSATRNTTGVDALREMARCRLAREQAAEAIAALDRLERRAVRLTLRAELMALRSEARRLLDGRGS